MYARITAEQIAAHGIEGEAAAELAATVEAWCAAMPPERCWQRLARERLSPRLPFPVHLLVWERVYAGWDEARGPRPAWIPGDDEIAASTLGALMRERGFRSYHELWRWSVDDRAGYWGWAVERLGVRFARPPERVLDDSGGPEHPVWLPGARLNIVASCFQAPPERTALIVGDRDGVRERVSYGELAARTARVAAGLGALGLAPGDAVAIDLPMDARAVACYLGVIAAGMRVVSLPESLAPEAVATRLRLGGAKLLVTTAAVERGGRRAPLYTRLLDVQPPRAVVLDAGATALREGDLGWDELLAAAPAAPLAPVIAGPDDVTNVLFSSGTTGEPKAIPWTHLTPIKAAADALAHFDVRPDDVLCWTTGLGWMMGPWVLYASLLNGATAALFLDGPTIDAFGRFVADAGVTVLGTVPTVVKSWRALDRMRGHDWSRVRCFGSTGEASSPADALYLMMLAGYRPVIEYCGGTEIGGAFVTGTLVQPASPATFSTPALGWDLVLLDPDGRPADTGEVFLVPPALGSSQRLLNREHHDVYYAGAPPGPGGVTLRRHGDQMQRLPGGYLRALGRVDDTMNLGGVKVGSAEIERVLDAVPGVRRTAAIAIDPPGGGPSELVVYAVSDGSVAHPALLARLQQALGARLNPQFRISQLVVVDALPVTESNKIMRRELRRQHVRAAA